jgi:hypothetical protein
VSLVALDLLLHDSEVAGHGDLLAVVEVDLVVRGALDELDVLRLHGGVKVLERLVEELGEQEQGRALVKALRTTRQRKIGARGGADTHVAIVVDERAAAAGEVVLLDDGHTVAGLREAGGDGDTTDAGACSDLVSTRRAERAQRAHAPTTMAVWFCGAPMGARDAARDGGSGTLRTSVRVALAGLALRAAQSLARRSGPAVRRRQRCDSTRAVGAASRRRHPGPGAARTRRRGDAAEVGRTRCARRAALAPPTLRHAMTFASTGDLVANFGRLSGTIPPRASPATRVLRRSFQACADSVFLSSTCTAHVILQRQRRPQLVGTELPKASPIPARAPPSSSPDRANPCSRPSPA